MSSILSTYENGGYDDSVFQGCSFFLIWRRNNGKWICNLHRPFLLHLESGCISGQFISTAWFKQQINEEDTLDLIVLRLPRRDATIHPDEHITQALIVERLVNAELSQVSFTQLDFVVLHKRYLPCDIELILETNKPIIEADVSLNRVKHQDRTYISAQTSFGLTFDVVKEEMVSLNTNHKSKHRYTPNNRRNSVPSTLRRRDLSTFNGRTNSVDHDNTATTLYVYCPSFEIQTIQ